MDANVRRIHVWSKFYRPTMVHFSTFLGVGGGCFKVWKTTGERQSPGSRHFAAKSFKIELFDLLLREALHPCLWGHYLGQNIFNFPQDISAKHHHTKIAYRLKWEQNLDLGEARNAVDLLHLHHYFFTNMSVTAPRNRKVAGLQRAPSNSRVTILTLWPLSGGQGSLGVCDH